jgi:hypothetical protein
MNGATSFRATTDEEKVGTGELGLIEIEFRESAP